MLAAAILALASPQAFAQGGTTSTITGVVVDADGGTVPGATIVAQNTATNVTYTTVSAGNGSFTIPVVGIGTYTVTVSLTGFKTAIVSNVAVTAGGPADVRATLEVGGIAETVNVEGRSALVQTQATSVSTTIGINQVSNLPLVSRNALDFIVFLPGVNTPGGNRDSTVNGLPQSTINITIDGMNIQDNYLKTTDGFFARMSPRLDAIEEVTVTSAAQGADAAGQGAIQIRFVTRSGGNTFSGSAYHYFRADELNTKDWFTKRDGLPKTELLQNQPGFRVGGPIVIPGVYDGHGKAFYFVNYEEFRQPQTVRRNRTILTPEAQMGLFSYTTSTGVRTVNVLALAGANGHISSIDPTVGQLLADIRTAASSTGLIEPLSDPSLQRFTWNVAQKGKTTYPTGKVDYNLTENHRLTFSINYNGLLSDPDTLNGRDPQFPGFAVQGTQDSHRYTTSGTLRSTVRGSIVNEFRLGATGGPTYFAPGVNPSMWSAPFGSEGGFKLGINTANISNSSSGASISSREGSTWVVENTVNWVRGAHSLNFGGSLTMGRVWLRNQAQVPTILFDVLNSDPAKPVFSSAANFPGASATQRGDAEDLYAVLVGRVSQISGEARIDPATNQFVYHGQSLQQGRLPDYGFWFQDAWRPRSDLTLNLGLRYELQLPFYAINDSYSTTTLEDVWGLSGNSSTCTDVSNITPASCNLFQPGNLPGKAISQFYQMNRGTNAYGTDRNNFAPSVGVAWTPAAETGWLARFLGQPGDTVFRAGFARSYSRPGMSSFTGRLDDNPGLIISANRTESLGNLGTLPILFRDRDRLGPPAFEANRTYPMTDVVTEDIQIFDPNLQVPYADTWTAGWQRSVTRNMAVEVRYVGTRARDQWTTYNINEVNIHENGFFPEFQLAQQNLLANIAAGRGTNFRYFGPGTGTSPLPTYLAYFSGRTDATNTAAYTSGNFASSTFYNPLAARNPNPFSAADNLDADAGRRANALAAGLPANFLVANPDKLGGADIDGHGGYKNFHGVQVEVRRRMAQGFQFQASYAYGKSYDSTRYSFRVPLVDTRDTGSEGDVTHALKGTWVWELPFGQGRRFGSNVGATMDRIVGGWQIHGTARIQSGRMVDFGNVRMVGFDQGELQDMYKARIDADGRVWLLPQDVIDNTVRAFSVDATSLTGYGSQGAPAGKYFAPANGPDCIETISNGYGDCGARSIVITGPMFKLVDMSVVKAVPIAGRVRAEFRLEMLNAFNFVNYVPVTGLGTDPDDYEVTGLNGAVTARILQLVSRVTW